MRNRMLNPELFKDEALAALPCGATLLFQGLWCIAEDSGCLEDRPRVIRSDVFGVRDDVTLADVTTWIDALIDAGKLERYEVDGKHYLFITKFHKHQRFKYLPKSAIPLPPGLAEELNARYARPADVPECSGETPPSLEVNPEQSGDLRNIPEHSGKIGNVPASRVRAEEKRREEKRRGREEKGSAGRNGATPPAREKPPSAARVFPGGPFSDPHSSLLQLDDWDPVPTALEKAEAAARAALLQTGSAS